MTQLSLLKSKAPADLPSQLINALRFGTWRNREELARVLGVSVRQIREAAHESRGEVLSSQLGLKLTVCATPAEYEEAQGRFASQVHQMTERIAATRHVWEQRTSERQSA